MIGCFLTLLRRAEESWRVMESERGRERESEKGREKLMLASARGDPAYAANTWD